MQYVSTIKLEHTNSVSESIIQCYILVCEERIIEQRNILVYVREKHTLVCVCVCVCV